MRAVRVDECVVRGLVSRIRKGAAKSGVRAYTEILAPGIGPLEADSIGGPQSRLHLQRMVIRVSSVRSKARLVELRIGPDKVFRKSVAPQHLALDGTWNKRQTLIACECGV